VMTSEAERASLLEVSVVVASFSDEETLSRCLQSLTVEAVAAEVIVATGAPADVAASLESQWTSVRFCRGAPGVSVFELRALGVTQARGRLVALIEDHVTVERGWLQALLAAHRAGHLVVGGPVDNGLDSRAYDWALYFCEYGYHMPPGPDGEVAALCGANVAYDRDLLMGCEPIWRAGLYENEVHDAVRGSGHRLYLCGEARVQAHLRKTLTEAMAHLLSGGRHFGRYRGSRCSWAGRLFWRLVAPAVPLVLLGRLTLCIATRRPRRLARLVQGVHYLLCLLAAWSAGEALGYWAPTLSRELAEEGLPGV